MKERYVALDLFFDSRKYLQVKAIIRCAKCVSDQDNLVGGRKKDG